MKEEDIPVIRRLWNDHAASLWKRRFYWLWNSMEGVHMKDGFWAPHREPTEEDFRLIDEEAGIDE